MSGICYWCNKYGRLTKHHTKYRHGEKVYYIDIRKEKVYVTQRVCRKCHDEIEQDYILTGRTVGNLHDRILSARKPTQKPGLDFALNFIENPPKKKRKSRGNKIIKNLYNIALKSDVHREEVELIVQIQNIIRHRF